VHIFRVLSSSRDCFLSTRFVHRLLAFNLSLVKYLGNTNRLRVCDPPPWWCRT